MGLCILMISQGSLCNFNREAFEKLESFELDVLSRLDSEDVLNSDETGIKINQDLKTLNSYKKFKERCL